MYTENNNRYILSWALLCFGLQCLTARIHRTKVRFILRRGISLQNEAALHNNLF